MSWTKKYRNHIQILVTTTTASYLAIFTAKKKSELNSTKTKSKPPINNCLEYLVIKYVLYLINMYYILSTSFFLFLLLVLRIKFTTSHLPFRGCTSGLYASPTQHYFWDSSCYVIQAALELTGFTVPPASASQVAGTTRVCHHAWLNSFKDSP